VIDCGAGQGWKVAEQAIDAGCKMRADFRRKIAMRGRLTTHP
jgi:hypothetical protein